MGRFHSYSKLKFVIGVTNLLKPRISLMVQREGGKEGEGKGKGNGNKGSSTDPFRERECGNGKEGRVKGKSRKAKDPPNTFLAMI